MTFYIRPRQDFTLPTEETGLMEMEHENEKNAEKREMKVVAPEETKEGRE